MNKFNYYFQIDALKAIAIIFVIIIHSFDYVPNHITSNLILNTVKYSSVNLSLYAIILQIIKVLTVWQAVPIFFVLMGLTWGLSSKRRDSTNLRDSFSFDYFKKKFIRIVFPYFLLLLVSVFIGLVLSYLKGYSVLNFSIFNLLGYFPIIGQTFGSYFITLLFQVIIVFPLIYLAYKVHPKLTLIVCILIDVIFQVLAFYYHFNYSIYQSSIYAITIFRFVSALALGLWLSDQNLDIKGHLLNKLRYFFNKQKLISLFGFVGIFYLVTWYLWVYIKQTPLELPYYNDLFSTFGSQNVLSFIYVTFIIALGFVVFPNKTDSWLLNKFGLIGKASYHIFLVQILYFLIFSFSDIITKNTVMTLVLSVIIDLIFCISLGLAFYYLETRLTSNLQK